MLIPPNKTALTEADQQIRNVVQCHLALYIYTRKRKGGICVPRMSVDIQLAVIKSVVKTRTLKDEKAAKLLRVTMPVSV
nr:unnamed protein product [Callosobruchus analis]